MQNPFKDPDDKLHFAKVLDKLAMHQKKYQPTFTDFLNPVQCAAFMHVLAKHTDAVAYGGYTGAERTMIGFGGDSFPITPISVAYNARFSTPPTHRDYLGAVLGLGLDRSKIGDICLVESGAVLYVSSEICEYITENLQQVGRTTVTTAANQIIAASSENTGQEKRVTVSSLRLDAVLSPALNLSRGKAATLIESDKVFVNWKPAKKTYQLAPGDNVTVRGLGRITINTEDGRTKKERIVLTVTRHI